MAAVLSGCTPGPDASGEPVDTGVSEPSAFADCSICEPWEACTPEGCSCTPKCSDDRPCASDGCGGVCECPPDQEQNGTGNHVPDEECHDSCESAGWQCGEVCGETCGDCAEGLSCALGDCLCEPVCDGTRCEDGCGGYCPCAEGTVCNASAECVQPEACTDQCGTLGCGDICGEACGECADGESCLGGACAVAEACDDCPLALKLLSKELVDGKIHEVTLAIDFAPASSEPTPRVVDLRIHASKQVWMSSAVRGAALAAAGKDLHHFAPLDETWRELPDGTHQLIVYSGSTTTHIGTGRIATVKFRLEEWGPVTFSFVRREQGFAPPDADAALQASRYDGQVIVTR